MRIAHVIARLNVGGTARWLDVLTTELQARGHEVLILTGNVQSGEVEDPSAATLPVRKIESLGRAVSPLDDLRALSEIRSALVEFNPDLVNTHTAKAGTLGRLAARSIRNRPALVHTVHGHLLHGYFSPFVVRGVIGVERMLARLSDLVLAAGIQVGEDLVQVGTVPKRKLRIVVPGVADIDRIPRDQAFTRLGLESFSRRYSTVVGWLARIVPVKGPDLLLEVARANPEVLFLVGGDGSERARMESLAPANVHFTGWTSPEVFWSACDIGLLTSQNEAVPYSLIEASLFGIPVVSTDVGSVRDVIEDGVTGFIEGGVKPSVAEAVRDLSERSDEREQMGIEGREFALRKFSRQAMGELHSELYEEALNIRKRRSD